jgi:hypothetical protein
MMARVGRRTLYEPEGGVCRSTFRSFECASGLRGMHVRLRLEFTRSL